MGGLGLPCQGQWEDPDGPGDTRALVVALRSPRLVSVGPSWPCSALGHEGESRSLLLTFALGVAYGCLVRKLTNGHKRDRLHLLRDSSPRASCCASAGAGLDLALTLTQRRPDAVTAGWGQHAFFQRLRILQPCKWHALQNPDRKGSPSPPGESGKGA